jgi:DNA polymerase sigma
LCQFEGLVDPKSFLFCVCRQKKLAIRKLTIIRTARIPLIKLETNSRVVADISLGDTSGPRAANYIAQQVRSLVIVLSCARLCMNN